MTEEPRPEVLISRLTSDNQVWRVEAELRLIALGAAAVEPLIQALSHASASVRVHAVHALGRIGDARALPAMVRALGDGESLGAGAIAAEKALVAWGEPAKSALLEAALGEGSEAVRARAVRALGRIGGADLRPALERLLRDPLPSLRTQAACALSAILRHAAIELIAPLLGDPDKWVRWGVAEALVREGCVRGKAALREAAEDPEEQGGHVQLWAGDLLEEIEELERTGRAVA